MSKHEIFIQWIKIGGICYFLWWSLKVLHLLGTLQPVPHFLT